MLLAITLTIATATFAAFSWALKKHFVSARMPLAMVGLSALSLVTFIATLIVVWRSGDDSLPVATALVIYLASATLFALSIIASRRAQLRVAFDQAEPQALLSQGPYRVIRHPFYTSYLLFWLACAVAASWWPLWLAFPVFAVTYATAARREEQSILASPLGEQYASYIAQTGFMFPRVRA